MTPFLSCIPRFCATARRAGKTLVLLGLVAAAPASTMAADDPDCIGKTPPVGDCGTHNMMIVGQEAVFVSHLPMFGTEHRFQLILEVSLNSRSRNVDRKYFADRKNNPLERMYTLKPRDTFVLRRIFAPGSGDARRNVFVAEVYRGHLERHGAAIPGLENTRVQINRIVYAAELPIDTSSSNDLTYILFGKGDDLYLAHRITRAPNFDQILSVQVSGQPFTAEDLARGIVVTVADRPDAARNRIKPKESVEARGQVVGSDRSMPVRLTAGTEFYFEEGELAGVGRFEELARPTALEREAGFD